MTEMTANVQGYSGTKQKIQKFGRFLSGMIMPNIGAFIAWGLITTLFIPTGWIPNENLAKLVGPMIVYMLPALIGYTGGKLVGGVRGGVVGTVATMGVIVGTDIPMFIGAMMMGPLGGWCIKKFDEAIDGKVKAGFEMLINNFSAGIIGGGLALLGFKAIGPVVERFSNALGNGVGAIVDAGLLPLASVFVEPAKILFLNNAINHGVFGPLGIAEAAETGKSIFFMIETNPGPGLGILLAFWLFGKGMAKNSAPGAIIIHFLGGIHEIYFPYVLMKPVLILAAIGGGASGVLTFSIFNAGLVATPSPGSIFAELAMTPRGGYVGTLAGVIVATAVSFVIAAFFLKRDKSMTDESLQAAQAKTVSNKGKKSAVIDTEVKSSADVKLIVVACDAGMGSSAMGATTLRNKVKKAGLNIEVINTSIEDIPAKADIVITQASLTGLAKKAAPNAEHISIGEFIGTPVYDELVGRLTK